MGRAEQPVSFFLNPGIQPDDFFHRWKKARVAAIGSAAPAAPEEALLPRVAPGERDRVLRSVFDNSRKLARGLARLQSLEAEPLDMAEILPRSGIRCFTGAWEKRGETWILERQPCEGARDPFFCDYWREAVDGLASGAGSDLRVARHRCAGRGDPQCVDVFFLDPGGDPRVGAHRGELPEEWKQPLGKLSASYSERGLSLQWRGYSEGTLFYRLRSGVAPLCGAGGRLLQAALAEDVNALFPQVKIQEDAGVAVMGGGG